MELSRYVYQVTAFGGNPRRWGEGGELGWNAGPVVTHGHCGTIIEAGLIVHEERAVGAGVGYAVEDSAPRSTFDVCCVM